MKSLQTGWKLFEAFLAKTHYKTANGACQPTLIGHGLITGGLISLNLSIGLGLATFASRQANEWLNAQTTVQPPTQTVVQAPALKARLLGQVAEISARRDLHAKVMTHFYKQYFVALSMASGSALAAVLLVFFISRDGWEAANNGLINAFFVTFSVATLYTQMPGLFSQKANLEQNRELYISYTNLMNYMVSYLATGNVLNSDKNAVSPVAPELFIHQIDQQLAELNQIPINFDDSRSIRPPNVPQLESLEIPDAAPAED